MEHLGTGAIESKKDSRTVKHEDMKTMGGVPLITGGYDYAPTEIEHQHRVGICTSISLTQNARKFIGRKLSADFQYLLQKKYVDGNWDEGSSIFSALKVGTNYGFLPSELLTEITEADRNLPYSQYIAKLKAIPEARIQQLIHECSDYKLTGYASVDVSNTQSIATAITNSKAGILCMYYVGNEWYTAPDGRISWTPADINPIRSPHIVTTGHAITYAKFNYATNGDGIHANTWGDSWDKEGVCDILFENYQPREGWIPYYGLTEVQIEELKAKLTQQLSLIQKLINMWKQLRGI